MITIINGNLLQANQLAEELGRCWFGAKFYHWHGSDFEKVKAGYNYREEKIQGALIRNCNDFKDLEVLIQKFSAEAPVKNESFGVIITTCCPFVKGEKTALPEHYSRNDGSDFYRLSFLYSFKLITVEEFK